MFEKVDWWAASNLFLDPIALQKIASAKADVDRARTVPTTGHVIASLMFVFWVSLLANSNDYETRLWRPALHKAFPGYSGRRGALHRDLYHVRLLRTRIAHYEPIHGRHLTADHATVLRVLGYLSPEVADWVRLNDRVPEVLARRRDVCAATVPTRF
ncbi:hypothetical protein [Microtetraspora malaysiensis]|uniref:hypothetical protein n=1 Tax=Microtetraspora malaysiensis TaxID=161358 RepID=UPI003D8CA387